MEIYNYAITAVLPAALSTGEQAAVSVRRPAPVALVPAMAAIALQHQGITVFGGERGRTYPGAIGSVHVNSTTGINVTTKKRMDLRGVPPRGRPV